MPLAAQAGFGDWLKKQYRKIKGRDLDAATVAQGIKAALRQGAARAIDMLSKRNGFHLNPRVRIPLPAKLGKVERGLRKLGADKYADDFLLSINRAAEKAVPEAKAILLAVIRQMTVKDAVNILRGPDDAATQFFRQHSESTIKLNMLPIIALATERVGVTAKYKRFVNKSAWLRRLVDPREIDLDRYITRKTVDGMFVLIADEEKRIRKDPLARTSEILKKVFRDS